MKIYTKTGDKGKTNIIGGRLWKDDHQVEAYGTLDEANSLLGQAISVISDSEESLREELTGIQHHLFDCGGDISMKAGAEEKYPYKVKQDMVTYLEERIDQYMQELPELERFILPGGAPAAAILHVARTVVRRSERRIVTLAQNQDINPFVQQYVNRLSDYLFVVARLLNHRMGQKDIEYIRSAKVFSHE